MIAAEDLKRLAGIPGPCLTIVEPVREGAAQPVKTAAQLTAAGKQAYALLAESGVDQPSREYLLAPVRRIAANTEWPSHHGSIVIFRAPGFTKASFWPYPVKPDVHLGEEFFILPLLAKPVAFWVLGLSINQVTLFRGGAGGLVPVSLPPGTPRNLDEAGGFDQPDHDLENRSYAGPSAGKSSGHRRTVHFGTSSPHEAQGAHLHDFFKMIDRAIAPMLAADGNPLILAGVSREVGIYEKINHYPHLAKQPILGSPGALGGARLFQAALCIATSGMARPPEQLSAMLDAAAGNGLLLTGPDAIARAAEAGQIETLFIDAEFRPHDQAEGGLLNHCAVSVLRNSGTVESSPALHASGGVAAILRYRAREPMQPDA